MFLLKAKGLLLALFYEYFEQKADIYISHMDGGVNSFAIIYYFLQQNSQNPLQVANRQFCLFIYHFGVLIAGRV